MTIFGYLSIFFLIAFLGVGFDLYRKVRQSQVVMEDTLNEIQVEEDSTIELDGEAEREENSGWQAPDFFKKDDIPKEIPQQIDNIVSLNKDFLPKERVPLVICPPTLEGMVSAALMMRFLDWAHVKVVYKDFFVKSLWKIIRMKPNPENIFVVGMSAGYVYGRRLMQTFQKLQEKDIHVAWYDNHKWLPVIAKNLSDYCFDFVLTDSSVSTARLLTKRFANFTDDHTEKILSVLELSDEPGRPNDWSRKWNDLLNYSLVAGTSVTRDRYVRRLSRLSKLKPNDMLNIYRYRRKLEMTRSLLYQQTHIIPLSKGNRMSVLDIRPLHREKDAQGKVYFVIRGEKPTYELPELAFKIHGSQCVLIIRALDKMELIRSPDSQLKLSHLIDITSVDDNPIKVDGRDERVMIHIDLSSAKRFYNSLLFKWPPEVRALIDMIVTRL